MSQENWTEVDEYVSGLLAPHDEALEAALRDSEDAGLPAIQVSPAQGKLLYLLARSTGNIARAGIGDLVDLRVGPALDQLPQLDAEDAGPFDLTFIDADKANTPEYFAWALDHSRPGSLVVSDNVVRFGELVNPDRRPDDPGPAPPPRDARRPPPCRGHDDPDRRRQGPRRLQRRPCNRLTLNLTAAAFSGGGGFEPPRHLSMPAGFQGRGRDAGIGLFKRFAGFVPPAVPPWPLLRKGSDAICK